MGSRNMEFLVETMVEYVCCLAAVGLRNLAS